MRSPCFNCCRKHLGKAQVNFKEMKQGYPSYIELCFDNMKQANDQLWKSFDEWQDCLANMSEASDEIVGMAEKYANIISVERRKLEDNPNYIPDFRNLIRQSKILEEELSASSCSSCQVAKKMVLRRGSYA